MGSVMDDAPHVVAIPFCLPGHTLPLLHLCKYLVASGCTVTMLRLSKASPDAVERVEWDSGVKILSIIPLCESASIPGTRRSAQEQQEGFKKYLKFFKDFQELGIVMLPIVENLSRKGPRVTCIISDVYVGWSQEVANKMFIPRISFWTSTVAELLVYYHMPSLIADGVFPFAVSDKCPPGDKNDEKSITSIPGLPALRPRDYPCFGFIPEKALHNVLHTFKDLVARIRESERLLVNSVYDIEKGPIDSLKNISNINIHPVGPLHLITKLNQSHETIAGSKDEEEIMHWLDNQKSLSVLYICFGTTMPVAEAQFGELAYALEELETPYLWAMRESTSALLPDGFITRTQKHGLHVSWAPQLRVLDHAAVGGIFMHCGWNSVMECIAGGVAIIARPLSADQMLTRRFVVEEWGNGLGLKGAEVTSGVANRDELKRVITALMVGEEGIMVKQKAMAMKNVAMKSMDSEGLSMLSLNSLVYDLRRWASCK